MASNMTTIKNIAVLCVASSLVGCMLNPTKLNSSNEERVLNKAAFFFECDKSKITTQCINKLKINDSVCSEFGLEACGNRAVYTLIGNAWIMTSSKPSGGVEGGQASAAKLASDSAIASNNAASHAASHAASQAASQAAAQAASQAAAQAASMAASQAASQAAAQAAMAATPPPM